MSISHPLFPSIYSFILLISCLSGCGSSETPQALTVLQVTDKKVDVKVHPEEGQWLSLYIGDKKWGSSGPFRNDIANEQTTLATLEVSDQIEMEDGSLGRGMIFTKSTGGASAKKFLAVTEGGPLPYGQVKIRDATTIVQTADTVTLADIETPNSDLVPISIRLEQPTTE